MLRFAVPALASIALVSMPYAAISQVRGMPRVPGTCSFTRIKQVTTRLEDGAGHPVPNSGSAMVLANGVYGVSYDSVPEVQRSRPGDRVLACLVKLPINCPPGDHRGKLYTTTNLRTNESWTLPDAEHYCGGA
jgi:hypothetical protein